MPMSFPTPIPPPAPLWLRTVDGGSVDASLVNVVDIVHGHEADSPAPPLWIVVAVHVSPGVVLSWIVARVRNRESAREHADRVLAAIAAHLHKGALTQVPAHDSVER